MAWKGYWNPLTHDDLWGLSNGDKSTTIIPEFNKEWEKEKAKADKKRSEQWKNEAPYVKVNDGVVISNGNGGTEENPGEKSADNGANAMTAIVRTFGVTFFGGCLLRFVPDTLAFVSPQVLRLESRIL